MNFRGRIVDTSTLHFHVTPFVDILLVLIAFFVLTWSTRQAESDLEIALPEAKHGTPEKSIASQVIVNIRKDGNIVVNQRTLSPEELSTLLQGLVEQNPRQLVVIRADSSAGYRDILSVLDLCRGANVVNIAFSALNQE